MSSPSTIPLPPKDVESALDLVLETLEAERLWIGEQLKAGAGSSNATGVAALAERLGAIVTLEQEVRSLREQYLGFPGHAPPAATTRPPNSARSPSPGKTGADRVRSVAEIASEEQQDSCVKGGKPRKLVLPGGEEHSLRNWCDVPVVVIRWLAQSHPVPLPFRGRVGGRQWLINSEPRHSDGKPFNQQGVRKVTGVGGQVYWIDTHRSAWDLVRGVALLLEACGVQGADVLVRFTPSRRTGRAD